MNRKHQTTGAAAAKFFRDAADVVERFGVVDWDLSLQLDRRPIGHFVRSYGYGEAVEEFVRVSGALEGCGVRRAESPLKKVFVGGPCRCGHHVIPGALTCWRCGCEAPSKMRVA